LSRPSIGEPESDLHCLHASHPSLVAQPVYAAAIVHTAFRVAQAGIAKQARVLRSSRGIFRNQLKYVFVGTAIGYICGATNFFSWYRVPFPPILNVFISLYVALVTYAIVRYRLMDINLAVTRVAVFAGVYVLLLGVPLLSALAWQHRFEQMFGPRWWAWLLVTYALLTTCAHYANQYFQRVAEDRLLAEQRRYQKLLATAAEGMLRILNLKRLMRRIVVVMVRYVQVEYAAIYLKEEMAGAFRMQARRGGGASLHSCLSP